jgi:hypothetical protein
MKVLNVTEAAKVSGGYFPDEPDLYYYPAGNNDDILLAYQAICNWLGSFVSGC